MTGIRIERSRHAQEFVVIGNADARNGKISFRARGLHHHLLSLPPGVHVTTTQLAQDNPEGRDAIRAALNELIDAGYVTRTKAQDAHGKWSTTMTVHDRPLLTEDGFPGVGFPGAKERKDGPLKTGRQLHGALDPRSTARSSPRSRAQRGERSGRATRTDVDVSTGEVLTQARTDPRDFPVFEIAAVRLAPMRVAA